MFHSPDLRVRSVFSTANKRSERQPLPGYVRLESPTYGYVRLESPTYEESKVMSSLPTEN